MKTKFNIPIKSTEEIKKALCKYAFENNMCEINCYACAYGQTYSNAVHKALEPITFPETFGMSNESEVLNPDDKTTS